MRAMVRRTTRTRDGFSSWLVADWKRRLNCSRLSSASCCCSWSSVLTVRFSFAAMLLFLLDQALAQAGDDLGLDRQLFCGAGKGFLRDRAGHTVQLEQDPSRLDASDPEFGRALARAHADLGRLRAHRNVREDSDPKATGALHVTRDRAARGLDLTRGDPLRLHGLEAECAEVELGPALGVAVDAAFEGFAELGALGLQHDLNPSRLPVAAFFAGRTDSGGLSLHHQPVLRERVMAENLALEDPHLHAANAISGVRLGLGIIDVAAQSVQRNAALAIPFGARDFGAAKSAGAGDADALSAEAERRLHCALHRAAEGDAALELVGDALRDKLGVDLGLADLNNVEADFRARHLLQLALQLFDVGALLADDHAGARSIDGDAADLGGTLDHHLRDRRLRRLRDDIFADFEVLEQQPPILLAFGEPAAVPGTVDLQAKPDRRGFLTHYASSCSRTTTRIWLNGFTIRAERPRARVAKRFIEIDLPTLASATTRASTSRLWLFSALATADASTLRTSSAIALGENFRMFSASSTLRPRINVATRLSLRAEPRIVLPIASASLSPTLRGDAGLLISACPSCRRHDRGTCASAQIRRASFRPFPH